MPQEINTALNLLVTGIITVFFILYLIVISGHLLILFANRFLPSLPNENQTKISPTSISNAQIAAITTAVEIITHGKGRIENIERKTDS